MRHLMFLVCTAFAAFASLSAGAAQPLDYTAEGNAVIPADYREWVFVTSSLDLNYDEAVPGAGRISALDNVFVNPDTYRSFVKNGTWPDKTVLVKENRRAAAAGSISKSGKFQSEIVSMEMHVKDEARFPGKWAFFVTRGKDPARRVPDNANCYTCHGQHGAVDTTFVQFYPTLLDIAKAKGTLSSTYLAEEAAKH